MGRVLNRILMIFLLMSLGLHPDLKAQNMPGLGIFLSDDFASSMPLLSPFSGQKGIFPSVVDLSPFCPPAGEQGSTGACAAFAFAYGALSTQENIAAARERRKPYGPFSSGYIYNQVERRGSDCAAGVEPEKVVRFLEQRGVCEEAEFPFGLDCYRLPSENLDVSALRHRIRASGFLFNDRELPAARKEQLLKYYLQDSIPVVAIIDVYASFRDLTGQYWDPPANFQQSNLDQYIAPHALTIIGYNDQTGVYKVLNSWGADWGLHGLGLIEYDDFHQICLAACILVSPEALPQQIAELSTYPPKKGTSDIGVNPKHRQENQTGVTTQNRPSKARLPEGKIHLRGRFRFLRVVSLDDRNTEPVLWDPALQGYSCTRGTFEKGTTFQLETTQIPAGLHVYIFSLDPSGVAKLHWPKEIPGANGQRYASVITSQRDLITIPDPESALQINQSGDDYLTILYCHDEVPDIAQRMEQIAGTGKIPLMARLQRVFGSQLIEGAAITYAPHEMFATCTVLPSQGSIMPIIVKISAI